MQKIEVKVTKLFLILQERGLNQTEFQDLIKKTNKGKSPQMYILNEIINGKRTNYKIGTLRPIKNALGVSYDELIDEI
jgi:transcriptional regulator with XRE-family HTH domain